MRVRSSLVVAALLSLVVACNGSATSSNASNDDPGPPSLDGGAPGNSASSGPTQSVSLPAALGGGTDESAVAPSTTPTSPHSYDALDEPASTSPSSSPTSAAPASADVSSDAPSAADQGSTGSCVTFAIGYSAMGWWANHSGVEGARFAPMYLYSQLVKGKCRTGLTLGSVLNLVESQGVDTQSHYEPMQNALDCATQPTSDQQANAAHFKISGYERVDASQTAESAIKQTIGSGRPAILLIHPYNSFENARAGTYIVAAPTLGETSRGGHAVTAYSYGPDGVWILNSWGTGWGRNGWALLSWDFVNGSFDGKKNVSEVSTITGVAFDCANTNAQCGAWQLTNQCEANPNTMLTSCCASCANPSPKLSSASEWFRIQNSALGGDYSFDNGVMTATGNYSGQYWKLTPLADGRFRLTNEFQSDAMSFDTKNMAASGNYTGQFWTLSPTSEDPHGQYRLTNDYTGSGQSLESNGAYQPVMLGATAASTGQFWTLTQNE